MAKEKDINKEILAAGGLNFKKKVNGQTVIKAELPRFKDAMLASGWVLVDKSGREPVGARKKKTAAEIENEQLRKELAAMKSAAAKAAADKAAAEVATKEPTKPVEPTKVAATKSVPNKAAADKAAAEKAK